MANNKNNKKPKQPFLHRGAGLSRFRMVPGEQFKPFTKPRTACKSNSMKKAIVRTNANANKDEPEISNTVVNKPAITPLKKPDLRVKPKAAWLAPLNTENNSLPVNQIQNPNREIVPVEIENATINSKQDYQESIETNPNVSDRELLIFETLEQRAMQSSFCSTNSSIVRLLSSTPHKNSPLKANGNNKNVNNEKVLQEEHKVQQIYENGTQFEAVYARQRTTEEDVMQLHCARFDPKKQGAIIQEILDDNVKNIQDNVQKLQDINEYEKKLENDYLSLIEKAIKFKQFVAGDEISYSSSSSVTSGDLEPTTNENTLKVETDFHDDKKWSDLESSIDETISTTKDWETTNENIKKNVETMTDNITEYTVNSMNDSSVLHNKLQELETELKNIRLENIKTNKLKNQLETQKREFEKHRKEIMKQVEDEKLRINFTLEEERKKLAKEKMVFERYVKDLQNKPSKKEREEISALKIEVAALQETLKMKETKNGMTQARLRNQIKNLEKENAALKAEVEKLNRQNAKLLVNQRLSRKPSDTKMLHEINKNLTKLAQEQLVKHSVISSKVESCSDDEVVECNKKSRSSHRSRHRGRHKSESHSEDEINKTDKRSKSDSRRRSQEIIKDVYKFDDKENDKNITNSKEKSATDSLLEEVYDRTFKTPTYELGQRLSNNSLEENKKNDRTEKIHSDGTKQIYYSNGNFKTISPDGNHIVFKYYNGDVKETNLLEGTVKYHYYESKIKHTTNADGTELIEFPNGQTEKRLKGGHCEIHYPNGIIRQTHNDGTEEVRYPDGTIVTVNLEGERILLLPNGQKEIHTKEHKRREYPDGTIKILYPDGLQETRYANGRVRLKDKHGKLLMDSQNTVN
ncbi:hypothetical protein ILUMI_23305 [Ignelater luminosus]|uniref:Centromere protein J C-terminal domain-containing protein n=1 Tax=Ignelater luminosus TaxID=2038154 RepID=A0A8K0G1Y1_IGNLU|nr:hypothetical protein ILUMI_23305 [Ignelater luminosus]